MYKQKLNKPKAKHHSRLLSPHAFQIWKSLTLLSTSSELCVPEDRRCREQTRTDRPIVPSGPWSQNTHCPEEDKPSFK